MIKKAYTEIRVSCPFRIEESSTLKHCEQCSFFNGAEKDENDETIGIDCLRNEIGSLSAHVTSFTSHGYIYRSRYYDPKLDGELSEEYNYCEKCCFNKILKNGNDICLLRTSCHDEEVTSFCCYEGEIWTKEKLYDEE